MSRRKLGTRRRCGIIALVASSGLLFQFGGCQFDEITTTTTLDGREVIIALARSAILGPIDRAITEAINNAFADDSE